MTAECANVRCPAVVLHRAPSPTVTLEESTDLAASLLYGRLEVLPGTSASLFFDHTDEVVATLVDFVVGRDRAPALARASELPAGLTAREVEVLRRVAAGDSNAEIADRLGVTINTVERHVANVYRKIDARGRADATAFAIRSGLA